MRHTAHQLALALRQSLRDGGVAELLASHIDVQQRRNTITVSWIGGPLEDTVTRRAEAVIAKHDPTRDVELRYERTSLWSCGYVHANTSQCVPEPSFTTCLECEGGATTDRTTFEAVACSTCLGRGSLDLDDPNELGKAQGQALELHARAVQAEAQRVKRRTRKLP